MEKMPREGVPGTRPRASAPFPGTSPSQHLDVLPVLGALQTPLFGFYAGSIM